MKKYTRPAATTTAAIMETTAAATACRNNNSSSSSNNNSNDGNTSSSVCHWKLPNGIPRDRSLPYIGAHTLMDDFNYLVLF